MSLDVQHADIGARHAGYLEAGHAASAGIAHFDLDLLVVELAVAQLFAETVARRRARRLADERFEHAFLGIDMGARLDVLAHLLAHQADGDLDQVADDLLDVAADIADLSELGRLDLDERRTGKARQAARYLGLADAGWADHQDVLRHHLFTHLAFELLAAPAVAQGDGHGALGVLLADDEAIEFRNDFAGRECGHIAKFHFATAGWTRTDAAA